MVLVQAPEFSDEAERVVVPVQAQDFSGEPDPVEQEVEAVVLVVTMEEVRKNEYYIHW